MINGAKRRCRRPLRRHIQQCTCPIRARRSRHLAGQGFSRRAMGAFGRSIGKCLEDEKHHRKDAGAKGRTPNGSSLGGNGDDPSTYLPPNSQIAGTDEPIHEDTWVKDLVYQWSSVVLEAQAD